ncbi:hypothetical protein D3C85_1661930 [compost metagenome]
MSKHRQRRIADRTVPNHRASACYYLTVALNRLITKIKSELVIGDITSGYYAAILLPGKIWRNSNINW